MKEILTDLLMTAERLDREEHYGDAQVCRRAHAEIKRLDGLAYLRLPIPFFGRRSIRV